MIETFQPGSTIGIFGGGQLGRMLALAACRWGYRVHVFGPEAGSPAGQVADREVVASYHDAAAVERFARGVDVVTFEFENVPAHTLEAASVWAQVRPHPSVLTTTQHRFAEKTFLATRGLPVAPFRQLEDPHVLHQVFPRLDTAQVIKTATLGYDGKGQAVVRPGDQASLAAALDIVSRGDAIMEALIPIELELSVVAARTAGGNFEAFRPFENSHRDHILDTTLAPARVPGRLAAMAVEVSREIFEALDLVGLACVEFFVSQSGELLVNEIAPRTHNSGHLTIEASRTSQFEQQLRAICGLPLGPVEFRSPAAMANLLGDVWAAGEPDWSVALETDVSLHLYGKSQPRPGRKMGHLTALGPTAAEAAAAALGVRERLRASASARGR